MGKVFRIVYVYDHTIMKRDYHTFGIKYLEEKGYNVEIWQIENKFDTKINMTCERHVALNLYVLTMNEVKKRMCQYARECFFVLLGGVETTYVLPWLVKNGGKYIIVGNMGPIPINDNAYKGEKFSRKRSAFEKILQQGLIKYILYKIKKQYKKTYEIIMEKIIEKTISAKPPVAVLTSTEFANGSMPEYLKKCNIVVIHAWDYDRYIEIERKGERLSEDIILFCDSAYGSLDQDSMILRQKKADFVDPIYRERKHYFEQLETVFSELEEHYGLPVVIAGHPHAIYDENTFCNRTIVFDKLCELTKHSKLFVFNASTGVSFPVLYDKEVLVLCNDSFEESFSWNLVGIPANSVLQLNVCNMDREYMLKAPWRYTTKIKEDVRLEYIKKYIISSKKQEEESLIVEVIEKIFKTISEQSA